MCNLRGVNLSGNCKTYVPLCFPTLRSYVSNLCRACSPVNDNNATFPTGAETVTFVGRPFPLDEAPQHLARLRRWGLTFGELSSLAQRPSPLTQVTLSLPILAYQSPFSHHLGGRGARWTVRLLASSYHSRAILLSTLNIKGAFMILPTSLTSAQFSRYSPSLA